MEDKPEVTLRDAAIYLLLMPWFLLLRAWVMTCFWDWFLATPFGWPVIGTYHWVGLLGMLTMLRIRGDETTDSSTTAIAVKSVAISLFGLGIGAAAHALM